MSGYFASAASEVYADQPSPGLVRVFLNRPQKMNAITQDMRRALIRLWRQVDEDPAVRVLILSGVGGRAFSAGVDRQSRPSAAPDSGGLARRDHLTLEFPHRVVSLAAIDGHALGAGLELALACDIRVCSEGATFGLPEISLGTIPGSGGTVRLRRVLPGGWARHLLLTGESIDSSTAEKIGLVTSVAPCGRALERAEELASHIAGHPESAVQAMRGLLAMEVDAAEQVPLGREGLVWRWLRGGEIGPNEGEMES